MRDNTPMTLGELRALLADYPDETNVFVLADEFGIFHRPRVKPVRLFLSDRDVYGDPAWRDCWCDAAEALDAPKCAGAEHTDGVTLS